VSGLLLGVIRDARYYRGNNASRERADAEYKARRPAAMAAGKYKCVYCGHQSQKNECHHDDGNHANNSPENFRVVDTLCHAYHHLGQRAASERNAADNLGDRTIVAAIPEISAEDLNLLQRAAGAALLDEKEAPVARQILQRLAKRAKPVGEAFNTFMPGDFAAAMVKLDDVAYQHRGTVIGPLRMLFHEDLLKNQGQKFKEDFPAVPVSTWDGIAADADRTDSNARAAG
jgi:intracellular multiplication protein IcmJ